MLESGGGTELRAYATRARELRARLSVDAKS
jgi:hypothetical protein